MLARPQGTVRWLHLSDLHVGAPHGKWRWATARHVFIDDLKNTVAWLGGPPEIIFFSGDITYSGREEQFKEASALLSEIVVACGAKDVRVVAVPGNHDLTRRKDRTAVAKALKLWHEDSELEGLLWDVSSSEYETTIAESFANYQAWFSTICKNEKMDVVGAVPGDWCSNFRIGGVRLGVASVNYGFLQLAGGDYKGRLALSGRQIAAMFPDGVARWATDCDLRILLSHHPPDWLHDASREIFERDLLGRNNFDLHMFGHMHLPSVESRSRGASSFRHQIQGVSLFGSEEFGDPPVKRELFGYSSGRFELYADRVVAKVRPRIAAVGQQGYYSMTPDTSFELLEDNAFEIVCRRDHRLSDAGVLSRVSTPGPGADSVLATYRLRLASSFERWDLQSLGVAQPSGSATPIAPGLDDMFVALRFAQPARPGPGSAEESISAEELVAMKQPLLVRGPAGAGKTTWMRHLFRQLVRRTDAFPVMIVLRDLARRWTDPRCTAEARSLDAYVTSLFQQHVPAATSHDVDSLMAAPRPKPVLLVDGWDEVGPLADELREKLVGFLAEHPHVMAVVTSRPYGDGQPSTSERFRLVEISPLSDEDVKVLARRFFSLCFGSDAEPVESRVSRFLAGVHRSHESRRLAGTPLLLTMMLFISRSGPLPDKRHRLYHACIENLLSVLPSQREEEGALSLRRHWRPADAEERLRVVAHLAARLHTFDEAPRGGSRILATLDQLVGLLPSDWPGAGRDESRSRRANKEGFIYWLAGPAGILTEHADGTFGFTHLSFQEYLTAWHYNGALEGTERVGFFSKNASERSYVEVLRLLGALVAAQSDERVALIVDALVAGGDDELLLAGGLLADGLVTKPDRFRSWLKAVVSRLRRGPRWTRIHELANAWVSSQQEGRKAELLAAVSVVGRDLALGRWLEHMDVLRVLGPMSLPKRKAAKAVVEQTTRSRSNSKFAFARVRAFGRADWPGGRLGLLHTWNTRRRVVGLRAQLAVACGATRKDVLGNAALFMLPDPRPVKPGVGAAVLESFGFLIARDATLREWCETAIAPLAGVIDAYQIGDPLSVIGLSLPLVCSGAFTYDRNAHVSVAGMWARMVEELTAFRWVTTQSSEEVREGILRSAPSRPAADWVRSYWLLASVTPTLFDARSYYVMSLDHEDVVVRALAQACQVSLRVAAVSPELVADLQGIHGEGGGLWSSLGRWLAGMSNTSDHVALNGFARDPNSVGDPALAEALRYLVRGDVLCEDRSVVTIDELCRAAHRDPLPVLEDWPGLVHGPATNESHVNPARQLPVPPVPPTGLPSKRRPPRR